MSHTSGNDHAERPQRAANRSGRHTGPDPMGPADRPGARADAGTGPRGGRTGRGTPRGGGTRYRRALRKEAPTVVAVLLTVADFTVMTGHPSFPFTDYGRYLHHLDGLLRSLYAQGVHVAVTVFDPEGYADYCATTGRPVDAAATRTRYAAEVAAGRATVPYTRQPLPVLCAELAHAADRRATWEHATDLLMDAGPCPDCGQDLAHCAFDRASQALLAVIEAVGPGAHHVVCSLPTDDGPPLLAALHVEAADTDTDTDTDRDAGGGSGSGNGLRLVETDALVLCTVMAASTATARPGGLVVRTTDAAGTDTVRGWALRHGEPHPLTEAQVFDAYCTDPATGDPIPPEPGVRYRAGLPLPTESDPPVG
ncbi:hypothetical protein [Actinacidiphila acididurans]|uniref:hypothetical protein n=1 Tax=Actinacidiphila acididurans TaxID=2784346 RepID=UPI001F435969|nr:hypothetical protein [Actinacidiphila acididurans]